MVAPPEEGEDGRARLLAPNRRANTPETTKGVVDRQQVEILESLEKSRSSELAVLAAAGNDPSLAKEELHPPRSMPPQSLPRRVEQDRARQRAKNEPLPDRTGGSDAAEKGGEEDDVRPLSHQKVRALNAAQKVRETLRPNVSAPGQEKTVTSKAEGVGVVDAEGVAEVTSQNRRAIPSCTSNSSFRKIAS